MNNLDFTVPIGIFKILRSGKKTKQLNLLLGAVREDHRGKGLDAVMAARMITSAHEGGFEYIDSHLELEDNLKVRAEMEKMGRDTLIRCGWFQVVGQETPDGYVLQGRYVAGVGAKIELQLSKGGQVMATVRCPVPAKSSRKGVYAAVDGIIKKVFSTPGPCLSKIAFVQASQGKKEVVTCNFDGSEMERLTHNKSISTEPAWGRDGKNLVYTLYRGNSTQIVQLDIEKRRQRRISAFPGLNAGAALSGRFSTSFQSC